MQIGQLAEAAGVTTGTIRLYERQGLISLPLRRESGYREYSVDAVNEIRTILQLKELGFTAPEIHALSGHKGDLREQSRLVGEKVRRLEEVIHIFIGLLDDSHHA